MALSNTPSAAAAQTRNDIGGNLRIPVIVITLRTWVEECPACSMGWHWSSPLTVVPSHSSLVSVKRHERHSLHFSGSSGWGTHHVAINRARIRAVARW
jgi:hypothetical protein